MLCEEILSSFDSGGKHQGLRYIPEMRKYCGKWSKVLKRVNKMMIEGKEMHDTRTRAKTVCLKLDQTNSSGVTVMLKNDFYWEFVWFIYVISPSFYVPG